MIPYDFRRAVDEWSHPPLDEYGYTSSVELLKLTDRELIDRIAAVQEVRYSGWRNDRNRWRESLGLDTTRGKVILDFGCGAGIEALQFAKTGNQVILADIAPANVRLADRVLKLLSPGAHDLKIIEDHWPYVSLSYPIDVFYAAGVIHHIPYDVDIMRWVATIAPEARLMLYSDKGWARWVGKPVPVGRAYEDPRFETFVRAFDAVGDYADFYNYDRIEQRFGQWWEIEHFEYICDDDRYCTVTLKRN